MLESAVTKKGQTTLPKRARETLGVRAGDRVRYIILQGEVRILAVRPIDRLFGVLEHDGPPLSLEEMDRAVAEGRRSDRCRYERAGPLPVRDDREQAEAARALLQSVTAENPAYACREVVVQLVWVLERAYGYSRDRIAAILEELVATEGLVIEAAYDVVQAAFRYRSEVAGFSYLMVFAAASGAGRCRSTLSIAGPRGWRGCDCFGKEDAVRRA